MAKLTKDEVIKLARLSKIGLSESEVEQFRTELESILAHVEQLQAVDTEGVEPTYQVSGLKNVTRPDEIDDYGTTREDLLNNASETKDGMIKVPKVL